MRTGIWRIAALQAGICVNSSSVTAALHTETDDAQLRLPEYSMEEIQQHSSLENGLWVSFRDGVYDVTAYAHSGGRKYLELAAGGPLEPFWRTFPHHLNHKVSAISDLEQYRIGTLIQKDRVELHCVEDTDNNEYSEFGHDPVDDRPFEDLIICKMYPFEAEAKPQLLGESFLTPNQLFYTRNHFPVPHEIDAENFRLDLHIDSGCDISFDAMNDEWDNALCDVSLTLDEIKNNYENVEIIATLQCSGNRGREVYNHIGLDGGLCCETGFISNAKWKGVRIRDVMLQNGYDPESDKYAEYKYMTFYGSDTDLSTMHYAMSVPIEYVMNKSNDCLLVWEMNGVDLPRDHGYPLRVLLPGNAGCRSVKWIKKIQISKEEVGSHWQQQLYQPYGNEIYDMPVTSVITKYKMSADGQMEIHGFAWSGGGRGILRVEVSLDDGDTWRECELEQAEQSRGKQWAWTLWKVHIKLSADSKVENENLTRILCRAVDTSFNCQPKEVAYNGTMYCNNAWHSVPVQICDEN